MTSFYLCIAIVVGWLLAGPIGGAPLALASIVAAAIGLVSLARMPAPPNDLSELTAGERVGVKLTRRARPKAVTALVLNALALALMGLLFVMAANEAKERERHTREFLEQFEDELERIRVEHGLPSERAEGD